MPTPVKFVAFFRFNEGYGWSEIHYRLSASDNPDLNAQLENFRSQILPLRATLLGRQAAVIGLRASYQRAGAVASLPGTIFIAGDSVQNCEDEETSLAVTWTDGTFTRQKITHLRGFWDSVIDAGFYNPTAPGSEGWGERFDAYKTALRTQQYGWLSADAAASRSGKVEGYASGVDQRITFTLGAPGLTGPANGSLLEVRFSRLNAGQSVLNRALLVEKLTDTTLRTVAPIAAGPFTGQGRFRYRATAFVSYNNVSRTVVGSRRMGKVFTARAGRLPARPRT